MNEKWVETGRNSRIPEIRERESSTFGWKYNRSSAIIDVIADDRTHGCFKPFFCVFCLLACTVGFRLGQQSSCSFWGHLSNVLVLFITPWQRSFLFAYYLNDFLRPYRWFLVSLTWKKTCGPPLAPWRLVAQVWLRPISEGPARDAAGLVRDAAGQ